MTQDDATKLTAKLFAAWDKPREQLTFAVYVERLLPFDHDCALRAVDELICSETWLPPVVLVLQVCQRITNTAVRARPALKEAPLSEDERAENLRRLREMQERIGRRGPDVSAEHIAAETG